MDKHPRGARGPRVNARAIRGIRVERGYTQTELARRSGVGQSHISRIELGARPYPDPRITKALADALGCKVVDLLAADLVGV
ncbi:helix-turn-helix transcriptional regulator [Plantactinospora sp. B6F1]|uniref:helix-turn-helix domain-containing protein n=1 Tax=Plantactinospora sp. B6F1 TaxID=3158971 RepID=UPI0032D915CD